MRLALEGRHREFSDLEARIDQSEARTDAGIDQSEARSSEVQYRSSDGSLRDLNYRLS